MPAQCRNRTQLKIGEGEDVHEFTLHCPHFGHFDVEEEAVVRPVLYTGPGKGGRGVKLVLPGRQQLAHPHGAEESEQSSCLDILDGFSRPARRAELVA